MLLDDVFAGKKLKHEVLLCSTLRRDAGGVSWFGHGAKKESAVSNTDAVQVIVATQSSDVPVPPKQKL